MVACREPGARPTRPSRDDDRAAVILRAVIELVAEHGYEGVTMEAVAATAGVSKATVYRRWPSRPELVVDAVRGSITVAFEAPDTGDLRADLIVVLRGAAEALLRDADLLVALLDASRRHRDVWEIMMAQFRLPGQTVDRLPRQRAIARGELSADCPSLFIDELAMPVLIHRILWHEPVDDEFVSHLVDEVLWRQLAPYHLRAS